MIRGPPFFFPGAKRGQLLGFSTTKLINIDNTLLLERKIRFYFNLTVPSHGILFLSRIIYKLILENSAKKCSLFMFFFHQTLIWQVSLYHHVFIYRRAGPSKVVVLTPNLYQPTVRALYIELHV